MRDAEGRGHVGAARIAAGTSMTAHPLVEHFYDRIWNQGDLTAAHELLTANVTFRGSLGMVTQGVAGFLQYVEDVRGALDDYRCVILSAVTEGDACFARVLCSGRHVREFRGVAPTGRSVAWEVAALFTITDGRLANIWVLGDITSLDSQLLDGQAGPNN
jgi:predicted ester cyclase